MKQDKTKGKYWHVNCPKCERRTVHVKIEDKYICLLCKDVKTIKEKK